MMQNCLNLTGDVMETELSCPKCRCSSVQVFPALAAVYYFCQYCRYKWVEKGEVRPINA